ncbi:hypothetical protein GC207_11680 [bacterium]|nr:hypothetical protein [bacterium]
MSAQAVGRRIRKVGELVRLCRSLRVKNGQQKNIVGPVVQSASEQPANFATKVVREPFGSNGGRE